jgi:FHS family glucose/mannose:H+ symporter-like MFS transporter
MPLLKTSPALNPARALTVAAHAAFVPIGIVTVLLGPMLPMLSVRWSLNYAQGGRLFTIQLLAATVAVALSGFAVSRLGFRITINIGLFAMAAGVGLLPFCSYHPGLLCIASYGFGSGLAVPAANLAVAEVNPDRRGVALNLLNFSWSLGAVVCPFLIAAAEMAHKAMLLLVAVSLFLLIVLAGIAVIPFEGVDSSPTAGSETLSLSRYWAKTPFLILGGIFFLYIGTELGFGGWITTSARSIRSLSSALAIVIPSFFYGALTVGRWAAALVLRQVQEIRLARIGLLLACAGMTGMIWSRGPVSVVLSVIVAGLGLSAVYPIAISLVSAQFGPAASKAGSILFTLSHLGGACLPWFVGYFSKLFANPKVGITVPIISAMLMYMLYRAQELFD